MRIVTHGKGEIDNGNLYVHVLHENECILTTFAAYSSRDGIEKTSNVSMNATEAREYAQQLMKSADQLESLSDER